MRGALAARRLLLSKARDGGRRSFADKGAYRVDYSDTGFQKQGYIDENCYLYSQRINFKAAETGGRGDSKTVAMRHEDPSSVSRKDYLVRERKLGDARRKYELEAAGAEREEDENVYSKHWKRLQESGIPEQKMQTCPRKVKFRGIKVTAQRKCLWKKRSGPKGVFVRFSDYMFPGSRVDEFTNKLAASKKKAEDDTF